MILDEQGRLLGKINVLDFGIVLLVALCTLGVLGVQSGWHVTSSQVVKGETDIQYTFLIHNAKTLNPNLFEVGKTLSITIRNQPRGMVPITAVKVQPKKTMLGNGQVVDDTADPYGYDYLVTVKDHAKITSDGYVTEGIKVKTGMKINVEGFDYRLPATIADIKALD